MCASDCMLYHDARAQRAAWLLEKLPVRGVLRLLDQQATAGDRPPLARLLAEQYMLEVLHHWEDDRVECALRLARGAPGGGGDCVCCWIACVVGLLV